MNTIQCGRIGAIVFGFIVFSTMLAGEPDPEGVAKQAARLRGGDTEAWRKIPWAKSLSAAARAAADGNRLLFVFSHDGNIDTGRC